MMVQMAQPLELLLNQFLMPDNDARRQAGDQIKRLSKDPQVVPALVHPLRTAKAPNVRQLAAILLGKIISGHWGKLSPQLRQLVKKSLIESITVEHSPSVRRASANVVSIIAKFAVPAGEWSDLLPYLFQCSQSAHEEHREVALILFSSLIENIGKLFHPYFGDLQSLLLKCLQDETSNRVRVAALKAVGSIFKFTQDEAEEIMFQVFQEFIPSILNVSRQSLASGGEDVVVIAFEIFDELIESPAPLGESVIAIVQFFLEVSSSSNVEPSTRHQAIQKISWLVECKSSSLEKYQLVGPILQAMCPLLAESTNRDDDDDDLALDQDAAEVINTMAIYLSEQIFPPILEFSSFGCQNTNPKVRVASVTALGAISEGCSELMKEKLEPVLRIVLGALRDPEQMVRMATSSSLVQFAVHLQPEIASHHNVVLPCILNALEDVSDEVKDKAYIALAAFCGSTGKEIIPFLDPLMGKLLSALQNSPRHLQETCMCVIGSVVSAAKQAFLPYAGRVLELMKIFMVLTNYEDLRSRARATELAGRVAMSVGRARMEPILPAFIEAAISGFGLEFSQLRECTLEFFGNVAELLEDGFSKYLPHIVPLAYSSCNLDDGAAADLDGVSSDHETYDVHRLRNISVRTSVLDEKVAATQALGLFALYTKSSYEPYIEETLKILVRHSQYFHENLRLQAIISLEYLLLAVQAVFQNHNEGMMKIKEYLDTVMDIYIKTMVGDDVKEVAATACMSVADIMKGFGYMAVEPYVSRLVEATSALLQRVIEPDGEIDEDEKEHNELFMDAISDLLAFAKVLGAQFAPIFKQLFEPLMRFSKQSCPPQDRAMVVATLAEVAQHMGAPIAGYVDDIMHLVLGELGSAEAKNRRNAAFCLGELCKNGGNSVLKYQADVLSGLYPLFGESERDNAVKDKAAGAVVKMIMFHSETIPLNQVLPILLHVLPLKEDDKESISVYGCICDLVLSSNSQIVSFVPQLVNIFAQVAISPVEAFEVKVHIGRAFAHLISVYGHQMQTLLANLPPAHADALAAITPKS